MGEDRVSDACTFDVLYILKIFAIVGSTPNRDDVDTIGNALQRPDHTGRIGVPSTEPTEENLMVVALFVGPEVGIILFRLRLRLHDIQCFDLGAARNQCAHGRECQQQRCNFISHFLIALGSFFYFLSHQRRVPPVSAPPNSFTAFSTSALFPVYSDSGKGKRRTCISVFTAPLLRLSTTGKSFG